MKIRRAPIQDLLAFLEEESDTFNRYGNILECIVKHYKILTKQEICVSLDTAMNSLCFCDNGTMVNRNFPLINGVLVRDNKGNYGITFHGWKTRSLEAPQTEDLWIWKINSRGFLDVESFYVEDPRWQQWGVMTSFYEYEEKYEEGLYSLIGGRDVKIGMVGRDIFTLQRTLLCRGMDVQLSGEFDAQTLLAVQDVQKTMSMVPTGSIKKEDFNKIVIG